MSVHIYQCTSCEHRFDAEIRSIDDEVDLACPSCGSTKLFEVPANPEDEVACTGCVGSYPHAGCSAKR